MAEQAGADSITLHLREDRRHIQDQDLENLKGVLQTRMNLEMAATKEMLEIAVRTRPADCCLVPERRQELTTEGGLDVRAQMTLIENACTQLREHGIRTSLFIDPEPGQVEAAAQVGADVVELHTGTYADCAEEDRPAELGRLVSAAAKAADLGLFVHAGHGLHYHNVAPVAAIENLAELNIGHSIIARAVFDGLGTAVSEMKHLMLEARHK
jgi:pyridoxine 5-phosphate synthase